MFWKTKESIEEEKLRFLKGLILEEKPELVIPDHGSAKALLKFYDVTVQVSYDTKYKEWALSIWESKNFRNIYPRYDGKEDAPLEFLIKEFNLDKLIKEKEETQVARVESIRNKYLEKGKFKV